MAGAAVQNNLVLIIVPLFALLALAIMFVVVPIFAGIFGIISIPEPKVGSGSASTGLVSMSNTLASFSPIYGIGLAIGMLVKRHSKAILTKCSLGLLPGYSLINRQEPECRKNLEHRSLVQCDRDFSSLSNPHF